MSYALAKKLFSIALNCFYSRVNVFGHTDVPDDQPVLFISNHSNAFVDPLLLTAHLDRRVTFTAKSTLSKNPLLNVILKSFSVELLLRQVDRTVNDNARAHNHAALQRLQARLIDDGAVYIFPEGRSHNDRHMCEFKTGAARLALSYEQQNQHLDEGKDLAIVPLGLHYDDKSGFRSTANIQFGEALSLRTWLKENPDANARMLTDQFKSMVETALSQHTLRLGATPCKSISLWLKSVVWIECAVGGSALLARHLAPLGACSMCCLLRSQPFWLSCYQPIMIIPHRLQLLLVLPFSRSYMRCNCWLHVCLVLCL